jgi:predicted nuclease of restriction endonuclease-like (RecB) superfamily
LSLRTTLVLSGAKRTEEREFYLQMAVTGRWNVRELARQIEASAFERNEFTPLKLSTALRELHPPKSGSLEPDP